jgi:hypothetical protein
MPTADLPALLDALVAHERFQHRALPRILIGRDDWRDADTGILWRWVNGRWRLDVEDAATAGVLVSLLDPGRVDRDERGWWRVWWRLPGVSPDASADNSDFRTTLGEAAARALAAVLGVEVTRG